MVSATPAASTPARAGRHRSTSVAELSHIGLSLFIERGFDETTVDDIARAAGIGRRTFFRYFASKNDVPWGDFEGLLARMRDELRASPATVPVVGALRSAIRNFNTFPPEELPYHRERMRLLFTVPSLVAHSSLRYAAWREVVAQFAAQRLGEDENALTPRVIGWTFLALSSSAYEQWLRTPDADLIDLLDAAFSRLDDTFAAAR